MKPQSRKAKGRRLQKEVVSKIQNVFNLSDNDVRSTSMGVSGVDIQLSDAALKVFPFAVECKAQESLNIWEALKQAEANSKPGQFPLLVFKRNHSKTYVALSFNNFMKVLTGSK